jgi:hypothetical protein
MIKLDLAPPAPRMRGGRALPAEGQRVQVTVCRGAELWQGSRRVQYHEGDCYVGSVAAVADDDLLDLLLDDGQPMRVYARDSWFELEPLE